MHSKETAPRRGGFLIARCDSRVHDEPCRQPSTALTTSKKACSPPTTADSGTGPDENVTSAIPERTQQVSASLQLYRCATLVR